MINILGQFYALPQLINKFQSNQRVQWRPLFWHLHPFFLPSYYDESSFRSW